MSQKYFINIIKFNFDKIEYYNAFSLNYISYSVRQCMISKYYKSNEICIIYRLWKFEIFVFSQLSTIYFILENSKINLHH
jgi:hypothetical protein